MKKYVKPELFYERFELSQHIADCNWEFKGFNTPDICAAKPDASIDGMPTLFVNDNKLCTPNSTNMDIYCYQPGTNDQLKVAVS